MVIFENNLRSDCVPRNDKVWRFHGKCDLKFKFSVRGGKNGKRTKRFEAQTQKVFDYVKVDEKSFIIFLPFRERQF